MYRIRFHGRGGQGIKRAGQVLGSAFFRSGFEVQDAPRYGAERRGAPIASYVRAGRDPIAERGVVTRPDLVLLADASLLQVPAAGVLQGLAGHALLLVASTLPGRTWSERLTAPCEVRSLEPPEDPRNTAVALAGAAARLLGVIPRDTVAAALADELAGLDAAVRTASAAAALAAFDAMSSAAGHVRESGEVAARGYTRPRWIELPREDASIAAPDVHAAMTSVLVRTGVWRTQRPVVEPALCKRCTWICSTLCPDGAISSNADRRPVIDYDHCKGCMVCVSVCPSHAIAAVRERGPEPVEATA